MTEHYEKWLQYMRDRKGDFEFRSNTRYRAVMLQLLRMGLRDEHLLIDVGAGSCQFGHYLALNGWRGRYLPVDAVLDGTDIEMWVPKLPADFMVAIEVVEHLREPEHLLNVMDSHSRHGAVLTTPNPDVVNVIACDPTHVSVVPAWMLENRGWRTEAVQLFGKPGDTIVAHKFVDKARAAVVGS